MRIEKETNPKTITNNNENEHIPRVSSVKNFDKENQALSMHKSQIKNCN